MDLAILTTDATIIATILTVSFSFSLFAMQYTAGNYTPSILHAYIKQHSVWVTFTLFSLSTIINLVRIIAVSSRMISILSIFLTASLLARFYNTYRYASPVRLVEIIERTALRYMNSNGTKIKK
jgi:hypothetical protein